MVTVREEQIQRPGTTVSNFSDEVAALEDTKTAVALPHSSESTQESTAGWWTFGLEVRLELWRNYENVKKTEVEMLPALDLSQQSFFKDIFCGRCNTGVKKLLSEKMELG